MLSFTQPCVPVLSTFDFCTQRAKLSRMGGGTPRLTGPASRLVNPATRTAQHWFTLNILQVETICDALFWASRRVSATAKRRKGASSLNARRREPPLLAAPKVAARCLPCFARVGAPRILLTKKKTETKKWENDHNASFHDMVIPAILQCIFVDV